MPDHPFDSQDPEAFRITHFRGPMTRQVREAVLAEGGDAAWKALLERVSPECRAQFGRDLGSF